MALNFDEMVTALNPAADNGRKPAEVTRERLMRVANAMAARGYKHTPTSLAALEAYLQGYGVMLTGDVGTGKTLFFQTLGVEIIDMAGMASYSIAELDNLLADAYQCDICLDDVGAEPKGNEYGVKFEYLAHILADRLRRNRRTHITMNLSEAAFIERYHDTRLLDRLYQLCKPFKFRGKSLRHPTIYPLDARG